MTNKYDAWIEKVGAMIDPMAPISLSQDEYDVLGCVIQVLRECGEADKSKGLPCVHSSTIPDLEPRAEYVATVHRGVVHVFLKKPYEKPLPMPEDGKLYFVVSSKWPLKYRQLKKHQWWENSREQEFTFSTFTPLRNPDNSLCECVKPNVKGGV